MDSLIEEKKWMQGAFAKAQHSGKGGTKGSLHRSLGYEQDEKIPKGILERIQNAKIGTTIKVKGKDKKVTAKLKKRAMLALRGYEAKKEGFIIDTKDKFLDIMRVIDDVNLIEEGAPAANGMEIDEANKVFFKGKQISKVDSPQIAEGITAWDVYVAVWKKYKKLWQYLIQENRPPLDITLNGDNVIVYADDGRVIGKDTLQGLGLAK